MYTGEMIARIRKIHFFEPRFSLNLPELREIQSYCRRLASFLKRASASSEKRWRECSSEKQTPKTYAPRRALQRGKAFSQIFFSSFSFFFFFSMLFRPWLEAAWGCLQVVRVACAGQSRWPRPTGAAAGLPPPRDRGSTTPP